MDRIMAKRILVVLLLMFVSFNILALSRYYDGDDYDAFTLTGFSYNICFSIELWYRYGDTGGGQLRTLFCFYTDNNTKGGLIRFNSDDTMTFLIYPPDAGRTVTTASAVADDLWHHLVCVFDVVGGMTIFIDGKVKGGKPFFTVILIPSTNRHYIGVRNFGDAGADNFTQYFVGDIDEVKVHNVALSTAQIVSSEVVGVWGEKPGVIAGFPCDEESGGLFDYSGNNNDVFIQSWSGVTHDNAPVKRIIGE